MTAEGRVELAGAFDIPCVNVVPSDKRASSDFGISRVANQSGMMTGCCGTFQWMAPYVLCIASKCPKSVSNKSRVLLQ